MEAANSSSTKSLLRAQLLQQRLRFLQIARLKPLREPPVNRSQQFTRLLHLALVAPEPTHAQSGANFPGLSTGRATTYEVVAVPPIIEPISELLALPRNGDRL
jgi:hypothetical protein